MSEPLFGNAHQALMFAFNFSTQQYERPLMNRLADNPAKEVSKGLSGLDGAGQAAMIFLQIERLPALLQFVLFAEYAPRRVRCDCGRPCCVGSRPNEYWRACIGEIAQQALMGVLRGCVSHRVLRFGIVAREFGDRKVSVTDLADRVGVSRKTAFDHAARIRRWLNHIPVGGGGKKETEDEAGVRVVARQRADTVLKEARLI